VIHFHKRVAGTFRISLSFLAPAVIGQDSTVQRYSDAGQSALAAGYYVGAERAYEKLRDLEPGIAEVHANLGLIYFEGKKFDQAVPALRQALRLKPSLVKSESLLAMSLSELGRYSEAGLEKGFHRSSEPEIKRMCGLELERSYTALKKDSKSVEVAIELNRLYPDDPEILYQTGKVYGNFAFVTMQKLAQVAPGSVWRHLAAAEAHESQGSYSQAIQEYREVLRLEPDRSGIHYRLGRSLMGRFWQGQSQDDVAAAGKEFKEELRSHPDNAMLRMSWERCAERTDKPTRLSNTSTRRYNIIRTSPRLNWAGLRFSWKRNCHNRRWLMLNVPSPSILRTRSVGIVWPKSREL
jgi:tetratricopeptide (TPR) repeat protein